MAKFTTTRSLFSLSEMSGTKKNERQIELELNRFGRIRANHRIGENDIITSDAVAKRRPNLWSNTHAGFNRLPKPAKPTV